MSMIGTLTRTHTQTDTYTHSVFIWCHVLTFLGHICL